MEDELAVVYKGEGVASSGSVEAVESGMSGATGITADASAPMEEKSNNNNNDMGNNGRSVDDLADGYNDDKTCLICPSVWKGSIIGDSESEGFSIDFYLSPCTMLLSVLIIWGFVIWCATDDDASTKMGEIQNWIVTYFSWFYIGSCCFFTFFMLYLAFSKYGDIKLGPKDEPPRFSIGSWFAMLFCAGIGIALYYWSVAEPVWHYWDAKNGNSRYYTDSDNLIKALDAMNLSWFHWGIGTGCTIYCTVGLPIAYFTHVRNAPLKLSSPFIPLIGEKYGKGIISNIIDTFAVTGTMFGVATSLGLGAIQLNAMFHFMDADTFEAESTDLRIIIIWCITAFATTSVVTGLEVGIRRLSEGNFVFSFILLVYLFFICDPYYLLNLFIETTGYHFTYLIEMMFITDAFQQAGFTGGNASYESWMDYWTVFYWGWWIAWSPFVGIFIAQISRGRTIREFIIGNVLAPALMMSVWFCVFGGIALYHELAFDDIDTNYADKVTCPWADTYNNATYTAYSTYKGANVVYLECFNTETMLFEMIGAYPLGTAMNILAGIGIVTYFVTSSDSASHIIDVLTANGNEEAPKIQRIFWALSEGAVASVLLSIGGKEALTALQTVSLAAGLPFCFVMLFLCYAFVYVLRVDWEFGVPNNDNTNIDDVKAASFSSLKEKSMSNINNGDDNGKFKVMKGFSFNLAVKRRYHNNDWYNHILDSTNIVETNQEMVSNWFLSLLCPCVMQWKNYQTMCEKDKKKVVFSGSDSKNVKAFMFGAIFIPSTLAVLFLIIGLINKMDGNESEGFGYLTLGLTFYVFFVTFNAWQRTQIRNYFGINGASNHICCDCINHLCCFYPWSMAQERAQCTKCNYSVTSNDVELVASKSGL